MAHAHTESAAASSSAAYRQARRKGGRDAAAAHRRDGWEWSAWPSANGVEPGQQDGERVAAMAIRVLFLRRHLGSRQPQFGHKKVWVVTEAVLAARRFQQRAA